MTDPTHSRGSMLLVLASEASGPDSYVDDVA
jgi:hypothetical protein